MVNFPNNIEPIIVKVIERLCSGYQPQKIILFGSYAHGHPSSESDIDILLIKDTKDNRSPKCEQICSRLGSCFTEAGFVPM